MKYRALKTIVLAASLCVTRLAAAQDEADEDSEAAAEDEAQKDSEATAEDEAKKDRKAAARDEADEESNVRPAAKAQTAEEAKGEAGSDKHSDKPPGFQASIFGFVELDAMRDSTQSFAESTNNNLIARRGTYAGNHGRMQFTAKNTRIGVALRAPNVGQIRVTAQVEADFFGQLPTDALQNDYNVFGGLRMRHAWVKAESPIVDVLAGQYHDLFGWGGAGFYPSSVAFLGLPGQIYHRNPQLRVSKSLKTDALTFEVALAAVRPAQRDAGIPDAEGGVRLAINKWTGASAQGAGRPDITPAALGVSGLWRRLAIPEFRPVPGEPYDKTAWGFAINAVIPVIPASTIEDRGNALTLTGEFSTGTGIADMYTGLTGGARFPALPNPGALRTAPLYPQNVDNGLVTFDDNFAPQTLDWRAFVVGLQYYVPIAGGKVWVTANYSQAKSENILALTPIPNHGGIFTKEEYFDGNVFVEPVPALQVGISFQSLQQTYGDGVKARNNRGHFAVLYFF